MHDDEAGLIQIGYTRNNSLLVPCGGYRQPVGEVYHCPGYDAHMHPFYGYKIEE